MKILSIILILSFNVYLFASAKTPSDVYSESITLKKMLVKLRQENNINTVLKSVPVQKDKLPRHVLQKTLEILTKVNKYREINAYGKITVPPVPPRQITPQDVYNNVKRLKVEIGLLLKDKNILKSNEFKAKKFYSKTPSDAYRELWSVSLAFDELLGQGFTPTDVYMQTEKIIAEINFLRQTQREHINIIKPKPKKGQRPNHALYKSIELIEKLSNAQKKLWIKPVPIPKVKQRVISPTEVYDSLQTVTAELNRISRRLGVERSFSLKQTKDKRTPGDVVQNLEYAIALMPSFNFNVELNQYPKISLNKTPSDVYDNLWKISYELDSILNIDYTPNETYLLAKKIQYDINSLSKFFLKKNLHVEIKTRHSKKPSDVYDQSLLLLDNLQTIKDRANMISAKTTIPKDRIITPTSVYNALRIVSATIAEVRVYFDIQEDQGEFSQSTGKTPSDVYSLVEAANTQISKLLQNDNYEN